MRGEEGLTVVEVLVAGVLLVIGGLGVLGVVDAATRNTFRAEQSQVVSNVLQAEMEELREVPYSELALTALPVHSNDPEDPNSRVASTEFFYTGRDGTGLKQLVYNGGSETIKDGTVDPGPTPFEVGDVRGVVYRYVVWDTCPSALCQDGKHLKRAVVVVALDTTASGGVRRYQEVQGQVVDPDAEPSSFPSQEPGGGDTVPWTLQLTDTPCDQPARMPPPAENGSHATHNTRGDCSDGLRVGNTPGAPDLLWPDPPEEEEDSKYDYATDVEPQPEGDEGLQMLPGGDCGSEEMLGLARGVATEPDADQNAFRKVHRWLSPPMPDPEGEGVDDVLLTGEGTLNLWTHSVSSAVYQGRVCAWLFVRSYEETSIVDTLAVNLGPPQSLHFDHFMTSWPSDLWTEIALPLSFGHAGEGGALPLPPGSRLGLALSVDDDTPTGLQFNYDQPSFDSRIELDTTGALPPGV